MKKNFKSKYRKWGEEQPYIPLGKFKLRLPFIHYRFELPEFIQGLILVAVALSAIAFITEGMELEALLGTNAAAAFQIAVVLVLINAILNVLHPTLGDPTLPGWITPALPLTMAYLMQFGDDPVSRLHALRALQYTLFLVFIVLGVTGMANKIISIVPTSIKSGVLLGAAIVAIQSVIMPGGRIEGIEISTIIGLVITFLVLYSIHYRNAANKSKVLKQIGTYGLLPGLVIAMIVGTLIGELPMPNIEWGLTPLPIAETIAALSVFTTGLPPLSYFIYSLPLVIAAYIIAFGDIVTAEEIVKEADEVRKDEKIVFNPSISHLVLGIRNFIQATIAPFVPLSGPLWTGAMVATVERYKTSHKQMDSIYGGIFWYPFGIVVALFLAFMVTGLEPVLPIAMSLTMIVTGWAAGYIAIQRAKTKEEQGIAVLVGCTIAFQGAMIGLIAGIVFHLAIGVMKEENVKST